MSARPKLYKAQAKFGPWRPGDVFESVDPWYEELAREGRLLVLLEVGEEGGQAWLP